MNWISKQWNSMAVIQLEASCDTPHNILHTQANHITWILLKFQLVQRNQIAMRIETSSLYARMEFGLNQCYVWTKVHISLKNFSKLKEFTTFLNLARAKTSINLNNCGALAKVPGKLVQIQIIPDELRIENMICKLLRAPSHLSNLNPTFIYGTNLSKAFAQQN